jgi:hypothetical protein
MARKPHTYHYIYKTTCKVNGKYYIGMHSTSNLEDGYIGSGKRLWNSIRKYGRENHEFEILEWFPDRSSLKEREKEIVNEGMLQDLMCMNLALGGEGGFISKEAARAGAFGCHKKQSWLKTNDTEWFKRMYNKRSLISKALHEEGKIHKWSGNEFKGKKHSQETIEKMRKTKNQGEKNSQFGKKWIHSLDLKENKRIRKEEEIPSGWKLGRKMKF